MKTILMIILLGQGYSQVPVIKTIDLPSPDACMTAKKIVTADLKEAHLAVEIDRHASALKKSDEYDYTIKNYSISCIPGM
ncbi:hypothetical protein CHI95_19630 [Providencia rettgeri]|uniref:Uncharacterized protein n=2 Tax=Providencia TaxID=586 RepID=A0A264VNK8_PRORE|nr:hypothetical protein CHI95_19630 [Providencia rettgeri]